MEDTKVPKSSMFIKINAIIMVIVSSGGLSAGDQALTKVATIRGHSGPIP
jgi:hypothetical protein